MEQEHKQLVSIYSDFYKDLGGMFLKAIDLKMDRIRESEKSLKDYLSGKISNDEYYKEVPF